MQVYKELTYFCRKLVDKKLTYSSAGNVSIKNKDLIYISANGVSLSEVNSKNIVVCDLNGKTVVSHGLKPSLELDIHLECYKVRDDISSVIHFHPIYAVALANNFNKLKAIIPDFAWFFGESIPVISYNRPASRTLLRLVAEEIKTSDGIILKNHGALVVGYNLRDTFHKAEVLEKSSKICIFSKIIGKTRFLSKSEVKQIKNIYVE